MAAFEFRNAQDLGRVFQNHGVRYLFFGKSGAILMGYSDTTQDVDLYVDKDRENCEKILTALLELGFQLIEKEQEEVRRGKDFIQLRNGPFDIDLIFAPDGIERFKDAWKRRVERHGFPVANIDDIVGSKQAANRQKDRESLPRLLSFRDWMKQQGGE
jgi:predicted nucleotidyltransferase